mmetsp:Transcript_9282/g.22826  ORF Transcript_9282/g.22826 Transcript_9282/m.22826 type:complete len:223 (-) Transcript_9282:75-743(-)
MQPRVVCEAVENHTVQAAVSTLYRIGHPLVVELLFLRQHVLYRLFHVLVGILLVRVLGGGLRALVQLVAVVQGVFEGGVLWHFRLLALHCEPVHAEGGLLRTLRQLLLQDALERDCLVLDVENIFVGRVLLEGDRVRRGVAVKALNVEKAESAIHVLRRHHIALGVFHELLGNLDDLPQSVLHLDRQFFCCVLVESFNVELLGKELDWLRPEVRGRIVSARC